MAAAIPIACELTDNELQQRRREYLDKIAGSIAVMEESESGFRYRFPLSDSTLSDLATIIDLERKCCPFLDFRLLVSAGSDHVSLELSGPEGTKDMIRSLLNWN